MDTREAVFIISVAARLVDMHPSTLRKYERCGLLEPCRMSGRLRLYSPEDIERLRQIKALVEDRGINLAGVELALGLVERVQEVKHLADAEPDAGKLRSQLRAIADEMLRLLSADPSDERQPSPRRETSRQ
ncbi:MAG: MerR family transcriptional regulator [Chloroflexota bacterium]